MSWLSRQEAADRVGKHLVTIYRWEGQGLLTFVMGRCAEQDLLEADRVASSRVGRPRRRA